MKKVIKKVKKALKPKVVKEVKEVKPAGFDPELPANKQREYR